MIEQLTEANRVRLTYRASGFGPADEACAQALRIIDAQATRIGGLEAQLDVKSRQYETAFRERAEAESELAHACNRETSLADAANKAEALAAEWQQSARDSQVEVAELRTQVDTQTARIAELEAALNSAHGDIQFNARLRAQALGEAGHVIRLEDELAQLRERVAKAEKELVKSIHPAARLALEALRGAPDQG